jgi:hypothetical protein
MSILRPLASLVWLAACGLAGAQAVTAPAATDPGILKAPPATGTAADMQRTPPRNVDPQMSVPPPADAGARDAVRPPATTASRPRPRSSAPAPPAAGRSRQDDCRGSAELCKQDSAR